jgi:hypothetical protein
MLLTDGSPNDDGCLQVYESAILSISNTEMIPLGAKLWLALEEISEDVLDVLLDHGSPADPMSLSRRAIGVSDVVVTPQMRRWHAVHTLEVFYRDAFNNQLNSRYQAKFEEYRELAVNAREKTFQYGIGLALTPIPRAQQPTFGFVAGLLPETIYYVRVSCVSAKGQEGDPSIPTTYDSPAGSLPVVTPVSPPAVATGFNVYMGATAETITLQTTTPIGVGQSFTLPPTGLVTGTPPGNGQTADIYVMGGRTLRRG